MYSNLFSPDSIAELTVAMQTQFPKAIWETFYVTLLSTALAVVIGLPLGVLLVAGEDAAQNLHALLVAGLLHQHALKAALQCAVLFDVAAVLGDGGGAHQLDLPAGELGLEDVGGVDRTLRRARADDVVNLVDKEDDVLGGSGFVHHVFDPLLEFAAVLGAGYHRD